MKKVMLIGYGAMAQAVIERLPPQVRVEWIVARESHHAAICLQFGQTVTPLTDPLQCGGTPDLVLECASQQAVAQYGEAVLARGVGGQRTGTAFTSGGRQVDAAGWRSSRD